MIADQLHRMISSHGQSVQRFPYDQMDRKSQICSGDISVGLDVVELILAVEDEFGIQIPNDMTRFRTVEDFFQAICSEIGRQKSSKALGCPSIERFFVIRDAILSQSTRNSGSICPSSKLCDLIAIGRRRQFWWELQIQTRLRLPNLVLPGTVSLCVHTTISIVIVVSALILVGRHGAAGALLLFAECVALLLGISLAKRPFTVAFPQGFTTVRDIVDQSRQSDFKVHRPSRITEPNAVWQRLIEIISDQLDVPISEMRPDARFVEDLKCD